jgi:hypothetical protein
MAPSYFNSFSFYSSMRASMINWVNSNDSLSGSSFYPPTVVLTVGLPFVPSTEQPIKTSKHNRVNKIDAERTENCFLWLLFAFMLFLPGLNLIYHPAFPMEEASGAELFFRLIQFQ